MAKISVAMTTYNGEKYVEKQLLSLLNQTRKADEVIIKDDCSTDHTAEIVTEFMQKNNLENWDFSVNKSNLGYKRNFYEAIKQTTGDIIFLCDQDDIWLPKKLSELENIMLQNSAILAVSSAFDFMDGDDKVFQVKESSNKANHNLIKFKVPKNEVVKISLTTICNYNISPGCTTAFSKRIKDIYLEKSKCKVVHDWEINFISATLNGLYFYNIPLTQYRIHDNNSVGLREITEKKDLRLMGLRSRLSKAQMICEYYKTFAMYSDLLDATDRKEFLYQKDFVDKRRSALEANSVIQLLCLYKHFKYYRNSITWQGRISDFLCVLKKVSV